MAQQYLLPCDCGKANTVSVAQAGRTLTCQCGLEYTVPSLAGLRQLESADPAPSKTPPPAEWNPVRGGMFVLGTILAIIGLALGGYAANILRQIDLQAVKEYSDSSESMDLESAEKLTPDVAYDIWKHIQTQGPGTAGSALTIQAQEFYNSRLRWTIGGFATAAVGILLAGGSLLGVRSQR
jgi:hypothetical protein